MIFLRDLETKKELDNYAIVKKGFILDLAGSSYLEIQVERWNFVDSVEGLQKDTRYNSVAGDGEIFLKDGVYEITVKNPYSSSVTKKTIIIGEDSHSKALRKNRISVEELLAQLQAGKVIDREGNLVTPTPVPTPTPTPTPTPSPTPEATAASPTEASATAVVETTEAPKVEETVAPTSTEKETATASFPAWIVPALLALIALPFVLRKFFVKAKLDEIEQGGKVADGAPIPEKTEGAKEESAENKEEE